MRKVVLYSSMSLDGYVASDRAHPGALPEDAELKQWKLDRITRAGAHLMGRISYQEMSSFWPDSTDAYAAPMNDIPKVVFSKTLRDRDATWPTTRIASGDLATEVAAIKDEDGADVIAWGGASFAASLVSQHLVDEYCLSIQPLATGRGQALFDRLPDVLSLELVEAKAFECGVVVHIYRPQHQ